jgi:hypothetical protein
VVLRASAATHRQIGEVTPRSSQLRPVVRDLSHTLERARGGITSDDATILLLERRGGTADHLATMD